MSQTRQERWYLLALLALLMAATRSHHFASALYLPDASLAVFFLSGLFAAPAAAFAGLLLLAGAVDYVAIQFLGVSGFCVSPAYAFLVPTYGIMWLAGRQLNARGLERPLPIAAALAASATVAFIISTGSFFLLSGRHPDMSVMTWLQQLAGEYPTYLGAAAFYTAAVLLARASVMKGLRHAH